MAVVLNNIGTGSGATPAMLESKMIFISNLNQPKTRIDVFNKGFLSANASRLAEMMGKLKSEVAAVDTSEALKQVFSMMDSLGLDLRGKDVMDDRVGGTFGVWKEKTMAGRDTLAADARGYKRLTNENYGRFLSYLQGPQHAGEFMAFLQQASFEKPAKTCTWEEADGPHSVFDNAALYDAVKGWLIGRGVLKGRPDVFESM